MSLTHSINGLANHSCCIRPLNIIDTVHSPRSWSMGILYSTFKIPTSAKFKRNNPISINALRINSLHWQSKLLPISLSFSLPMARTPSWLMHEKLKPSKIPIFKRISLPVSYLWPPLTNNSGYIAKCFLLLLYTMNKMVKR